MVDVSIGGIALMKQQESFLRDYFDTVFCPRDFEHLHEFLDLEYVAFMGPETKFTEDSAKQGLSVIKPLLMDATQELEGCKVQSLLCLGLEDEDKEMANEFASYKANQGEDAFRFQFLDFVCDWLCKCDIELSTGQHILKLWMFSPSSGKLCCSWNMSRPATAEASELEDVTIPKRIFKLAIKSEMETFHEDGRICSTLDATDGFVHLSDRNSVPVVAQLFFEHAQDLQILEVSAEALPGAIQWITGS